jgi:hypothetical protein
MDSRWGLVTILRRRSLLLQVRFGFASWLFPLKVRMGMSRRKRKDCNQTSCRSQYRTVQGIGKNESVGGKKRMDADPACTGRREKKNPEGEGGQSVWEWHDFACDEFRRGLGPPRGGDGFQELKRNTEATGPSAACGRDAANRRPAECTSSRTSDKKKPATVWRLSYLFLPRYTH